MFPKWFKDTESKEWEFIEGISKEELEPFNNAFKKI